MGSGLIVSVAYMDPGNWGTDIAGGASFNYDLLWVVWLASGMAMLFQYLSGKLGIAGYSLLRHFIFSNRNISRTISHGWFDWI